MYKHCSCGFFFSRMINTFILLVHWFNETTGICHSSLSRWHWIDEYQIQEVSSCHLKLRFNISLPSYCHFQKPLKQKNYWYLNLMRNITDGIMSKVILNHLTACFFLCSRIRVKLMEDWGHSEVANLRTRP